MNEYNKNAVANIATYHRLDCRKPNPYTKASFISKILVLWPWPLLKLGVERPLEEEDLPQISIEQSASFNRVRFEKLWQNEVKRVEGIIQSSNNALRPSLHRALAVDFFKSTWPFQILFFVCLMAKIGMGIAIGNLTQALVEKKRNDLLTWAGLYVMCNFVAMLEVHALLRTFNQGMDIRTGATATIFSKSLRLPSSSSLVSSGHIMTVVGKDVEFLSITARTFSFLLLSPIQVIISLVIGVNLIGVAFVIGMLVNFTVFPLQIYFGASKPASERSKVRFFLLLKKY